MMRPLSSCAVLASIAVALLVGCPPPVPSPACKQAPSQCPCAFELVGIKSMKLGGPSGTASIARGQQTTIPLEIEAATVQRSALYCVAFVAGSLQTNRLTDNHLGGMFYLPTSTPGRYATSVNARCTSAGKIEIQLFQQDSAASSSGIPPLNWVPTNTSENGIYAVSLTLPVSASFATAPVTNVLDVKCN